MKQFILYLSTFLFATSIFGQIGEFEGDVLISDGTPKLTLFDDADNQAEFSIGEIADDILIRDIPRNFIVEHNNLYMGNPNSTAGTAIGIFRNLNPNTNLYNGDINLYHENGRTIKIDAQSSNNNVNTNAFIGMYKTNQDINVRLDALVGTSGRLTITGESEATGADGPYNTAIRLVNRLNNHEWDLGQFEDSSGGIDNGTRLFFAYEQSPKAVISTTGAYIQTSDRKLKDNIENLPSVLDKINQLKPSEYNYKNNSQEKQFGFIAQDMLKVFPEVVSSIDYDEETIKMINYSGLIPILTKAIQEQQTLITELVNENKDINNVIKDYEERLLKLEK